MTALKDDVKKMLRSLRPEHLAGFSHKEKRQLFGILQKAEWLRSPCPIGAFDPYPKQEAFIRSRKRVTVLLGGNRSGKTTVGACKALGHSLGYYPWLVPDFKLVSRDGTWQFPRRDEVPPETWVYNWLGDPIDVPNMGMIVSGQGFQRGVGLTVFRKLSELWPLGSQRVPWTSRRGQSGSPIETVFQNGSKIIYGSAEQERSAFEGFALDWAWFDEPVPLYVYNGVWRALTDKFGSLWLTQTPLGMNSRWVFHDIIEAKRDDSEIFNVSIYDNRYLDPVKVESFVERGAFNQQELAARVEGRFDFLGNIVYPSFDPEVHVVERFNPPWHWPRGLTIDPHIRRPWFLGWWVLDPMNKIIFYREYPNEPFHKLRSCDLSIADWVSVIRRIEGKEQILWRICDPQFGKYPVTTSKTPTKTIQQELSSYGLEFTCRIDSSIDHGIAAVNNALRWDTSRPLAPDNEPELFFMDNCENLIRAMENFSWKPIKDDTDVHENLSKEYKDGADVVRFTVTHAKPRTFNIYSYIPDGGVETWNDM